MSRDADSTLMLTPFAFVQQWLTVRTQHFGVQPIYSLSPALGWTATHGYAYFYEY